MGVADAHALPRASRSQPPDDAKTDGRGSLTRSAVGDARVANVTPHKKRRVLPLLGVVLCAFALWVLHRELGSYGYADVGAQLLALPRRALVLACLLTV